MTQNHPNASRFPSDQARSPQGSSVTPQWLLERTGPVFLLAGSANIIMQLARPAVGYGVVRSVVDEGRIDKHPIKRARTTLTYLAVALLGTDEERAAYRRAVNRSHAQVNDKHVARAGGKPSPVEYNAFDPELQLWVAVCLAKGVLDVARRMDLDLAGEQLDEAVRALAPLGTTLQVRPEMWPASFQEFEEHWARQESAVHIDYTVWVNMNGLSRLLFLRPAFLFGPIGRMSHFFTVGFLPRRFRQEMRFLWSPREERRLTFVLGGIRAVLRRAPLQVRLFPFNVALWDMRRRTRAGLPLV